MLALVTGATGQVGSHLVERLHADGWRVRALVRDPSRARWLEPLGADLAVGDVLAADAFARAAAGCDVIFHAAAAITPRGGWQAYRSTNVEGTRAAIGAAESSGARLLHVSSVAVYGGSSRYRADGRRTDESAPLAPLDERAYYARSKRESETMVMDAHRAGRIWAAAVRPDVIYGRRDRQFVPRTARMLRLGILPLVGGGGSTLAIVHAANVADGAVRAATTDAAAGQAYNLANDYDVTVRDFLTLGARALGVRARPVPVPFWLARAGVRALQGVVALTRGAAVAAQAGGTLDFMTRDNPFSSDRARRELGWAPPVRPETGVPEAFRWWKEHGATA